MKRFTSMALITSCAVSMALGALAGLAPGCGKFGYGPLADSIGETIESARQGEEGGGSGGGETSESDELSASELTVLDQLFQACVTEPITVRYLPSMYSRVVEVASSSIPADQRPDEERRAHRAALFAVRRSVIDCIPADDTHGMRGWFFRQWRTRVLRAGSFAPDATEFVPEADIMNALSTIQATPEMDRGSAMLRIYFRQLARGLDPDTEFSDAALVGDPVPSSSEAPDPQEQ